jgi:hypothetical protein
MPRLAWVLATILAGRAPDEPQARVDLSWRAPAGCPDRHSVADDLGRLSDGAVVATAGAAHQARAVVREDPAGFVLELELHAADGAIEQRRLEGSDCTTLAFAAALMIAVAAAPVPTAARVVPAPGTAVPEPRPAPAVERPPSRGIAPAPIAPAPRRDAGPIRRHHAVVGAWAGPIVAVLPGPGAILGGDVAWRFASFGLQLEGWHAFAVREDLGAQVAVRAALSGGGLRLLFAPRVGPVELPLGVGVQAGVLHGSGTGDRVVPDRTRGWWSAVVAGVGLAWPASPEGLARSRGFGLRLSADALVAVRRPGIHVEDAGMPVAEFRVPPLGVRVLLGPQLRFP